MLKVVDADEEARVCQLILMLADWNGLGMIQRAKAQFPLLEIVIISGYAHFEFAQTAIKYGVGDYLLKPIKREELMATLEKLGQRCRQRRQSASEMERLRQSNQETVDQLRARLPLDILNGQAVCAQALQRAHHPGKRV